MADYILRADAVQCANDLAEDFANERLDSASYGAQAVGCWLEDILAADVVEVVRCKDCKLMSHDEHGYWCINDYQASLDPDKDYCSRAVRRADNGSP